MEAAGDRQAPAVSGSRPARSWSRGVRRITLEGGGVALSAALSEAACSASTTPRATVVALHGAGMNAGYFDGQVQPEASLLTLGAELGYTVLAVDRPGYGESASVLPEGLGVAQQAELLDAALTEFARRHEAGAGLFIVAHSFGAKVALNLAADTGLDLLGLDLSGCGHRYAGVDGAVTRAFDPRSAQRAQWWGPLRLYPPDTFRSSAALVAPTPARELGDVARWPELFPGIAARVKAPVRFTFAEFEAWWRHDAPAVADLISKLAASRVAVDHQPDAGHNISLGFAARSYHLRAFAFLEECMARRNLPED
jgi:pimeloyl-ACP methyl ester carboxylesterase